MTDYPAQSEDELSDGESTDKDIGKNNEIKVKDMVSKIAATVGPGSVLLDDPDEKSTELSQEEVGNSSEIENNSKDEGKGKPEVDVEGIKDMPVNHVVDEPESDPLDEVYKKNEKPADNDEEHVEEENFSASQETETETEEGGQVSDDLLKLLLSENKLSREQVEKIQFSHIKSGKPVLELLREENLISTDDLMVLRAKSAGIDEADLANTAVSPQALNKIPQSVANRFYVLPIEYDPDLNQLKVAMADPTDLDALQFLEKKTGTQIKTLVAPKSEILKKINERYDAGLSSEVSQVLQESDLGTKAASPTSETKTDDASVIRDAPISKIVSYVLDYAIKMRASDVHIEPQEERTRIRYRVDGILQEKLVLPKKVHDALVSRIKISSDLKIDEKRLPQDGRFNYTSKDQDVDLRISTLPTVHGEKIVMRLLKKNEGAATFQELGFRGRALKIVEESMLKPNGIILVTGPTGSGKTTTLYSVLTRLNTPKVNIMTLEDPVEYQIAGVNQVQINAPIGLTFASGLRSFLRQDPNIIMVGEIRDTETANLAVQASLTGHLVLSTLHTNSAAGALPRLLDMGVETFLLSSSLIAVVAQRVTRKICESCKVEKPLDDVARETLKRELGSLFPKGEFKIYEGQKCAECNGTGYQGRVGIFEVLPITEKISKMILERQSTGMINKQAMEDGMITMKQDGYLKVVEGITTIEEVLRVAEV